MIARQHLCIGVYALNSNLFSHQFKAVGLLDSFVALRSVKRFPPKTDQIEEASL